MNTDRFKSKLEEELHTLNREIGENANVSRTEDASATESDEVADKIEDMEEGKGENLALRARKEEVEAALKRIKDGTYGTCEEGGEAIEEERLEANPAARTCAAHTQA
ncbi:MAG TPA: TraR/DksA C4-type zinc finger protein [Candidatus Paceibacterota bacterium]|nr:TraR/DksA C4-type zinc finger protein [Candidatus Paceibacterota bacterium]